MHHAFHHSTQSLPHRVRDAYINLFFFVRISLELIDPNDILDKKQNAKVHVAYKNNLKG